MITLNKEQIMRVIPHRDPILLVDEVTEHVPGELIRTRFTASPDYEIFKGHFPKQPILPGVYTVECMAQAASVLLLSQEEYAGKTPLFLAIDKVRFSAKITPDSTIEITARVHTRKPEKAIVTCVCEAWLQGVLAATGEVTLAVR